MVIHPTQVHTQIAIFWYSNIDYSDELIGSALVRLERSTLSEHNGTRTVVLRFLKIITPVKCVIPSYDHHVCIPKEGELHKKGFAQPRPWSANIDKPNGYMSRGLQLLWDT